MLAVSSMQQGLIHQLSIKAEGFDLEGKVLSHISGFSDSNKAELLGIAAPKLKSETLAEAFAMLMSVENSLTKGLALVSFLPYLEKKDLGVATKTIFSCIEAVVSQEEKFDLASKFIKQLEENIEYSKFPNELYIIKLPETIALMIKNGFSLNQQIILEGQAYRLMGWERPLKYYSSYPEEKTRFLEAAKAADKPKDKYLILLSLLKHFPLEQNEIAELANLALETLEQQSDSQKSNENDDLSENDSITIENKIELLRFLPTGKSQDAVEQRYESFAVLLHKEISQTKQSLIDEIISLKLFLRAYSLEFTLDNHNCGEDVLDHLSWLEGHQLYDRGRGLKLNGKNTQQECYKLLNLLAKGEWIDEEGFPHSLWLIEQIKDPIIKLDALVLLLEAIKRNLQQPLEWPLSSFYLRLKKETRQQAIEQAFNTLSLIEVEDKEESLLLTISLLPYLSPSPKKKIAANLLSEIALVSNEVKKAELLVELLPYLNSELRREAFNLAQRVNKQTDRAWTLTSFAPYLSHSQKQKILKQAIERLEKSTPTVEKVLLIKQLIRCGF